MLLYLRLPTYFTPKAFITNIIHAECWATYKQCVCLCSKYKKMYGRILKSLNIVNLYLGMSKLKLKINVNVPQLLGIVVIVYCSVLPLCI